MKNEIFAMQVGEWAFLRNNPRRLSVSFFNQNSFFLESLQI